MTDTPDTSAPAATPAPETPSAPSPAPASKPPTAKKVAKKPAKKQGKATSKKSKKGRKRRPARNRPAPGPLDGAPRFVLTVAGSLLLASPRIVPALSGEADPVEALLVWLAAIIITFIAVSFTAAALRHGPRPDLSTPDGDEPSDSDTSAHTS